MIYVFKTETGDEGTKKRWIYNIQTREKRE